MENRNQQRNAVEDALRGLRIAGEINFSDIEVRENNGLWWVELLVPMEDDEYPENEINNIKTRLIGCFDYDESDLEIGDKGQDSDMTFETENPATDYVKLQVVDRR